MAVTSLSNNGIKRKVAGMIDHAVREQDRARTPEYFGRVCLIYATLLLILVPDLIGLGRLVIDIFEPVQFVPAMDIFFEGLVLLLVYFFGVAIVAVATANYPELEYVLVLLALAMVVIGGAVLGRMSNSCIPDLSCDGGKFLLGLGIVSGASIIGYVLPVLIRRWTPWMGVVYLAVAVWTAELWLLKALDSHGIQPTDGALSGAVILVYAAVWIAIFARMPKPEK